MLDWRADCVAGATLWQPDLQISWRAQHFRQTGRSLHGRRNAFAKLGTDFVAAQRFCKVRDRFCGFRNGFLGRRSVCRR